MIGTSPTSKPCTDGPPVAGSYRTTTAGPSRSFGGQPSAGIHAQSRLGNGTLERVGPELQQAVTELYAAFADYPRPAFIEGCECCWGGDGALQLHEGEVRGSVRVPAPRGSRPLHALAPTEISNVAAEVPFTGGTLEVFKH